MSVGEFLEKYGMLALGILGSIFGWLFGLKKAQQTIDQFKEEVHALKDRVQHLERQGNTGALAMATVTEQIVFLRETIEHVRVDQKDTNDLLRRVLEKRQ